MYIDRVTASTASTAPTASTAATASNDLPYLIAAIRSDPEFGATANGCLPDYELAIQLGRAGAVTHAAAIEVGRRLSARIQRSYRW